MKKLSGVWWGLMSGAALAVTYGLFPHNAGWVPAWCGLALLHGVAAWGLVADKGWARPFAIGLGLFGLGTFTQAMVVLGALPSVLVGLGAYGVGLGLVAFVQDAFDLRQRLALILASAALVPAAGFALAPEQTGGVMLAVIAGAACMWIGAWGVARGRTWGLLLGLLGAPILGVSVMFAPSTAYFDVGDHFLVSQPLQPLMLDVLGSVATACAALSVAPYAAGIARFLRRETT